MSIRVTDIQIPSCLARLVHQQLQYIGFSSSGRCADDHIPQPAGFRSHFPAQAYTKSKNIGISKAWEIHRARQAQLTGGKDRIREARLLCENYWQAAKGFAHHSQRIRVLVLFQVAPYHHRIERTYNINTPIVLAHIILFGWTNPIWSI